MKRVFSAALVLGLALAGVKAGLAANSNEEGRPHDTGDVKEDLPYKDKITWDVKALENDTKSFTLVERIVDKKELTWVLEIKTDEAANKISFLSNVSRYSVTFFDEDKKQISSTALIHAGTLAKGERVRLTLAMPGDDQLKRAKSAKLGHR